ncbi:MAG: Rnase Y domain-containing protein, partial [Rhodothermales bacterium]
MITVGLTIAVAVVALGIGIAVDRFFLARSGRARLAQAEKDAERILLGARDEAETYRHEHVEKASAELVRSKEAAESEYEESRRALRRIRHKLAARRDKLNRRAQRINERESLLHKASEAIEALRKEADESRRDAEALRTSASSLLDEARSHQARYTAREQELEGLRARLEKERTELTRMVEQQIRKLEQVSGMTQREARDALLEQFVDEARLEAQSQVKEIRDEAKLKANREARKIILTAIQRTAASHAIENTVSVVNIQSDEMKGRIIGREGRNIRAFEAETGIEVIVDDTPEAVILSGFDPVRREIARISLIRLVQDGRIHPARIEEVVQKVREEIEEEIVETGERTVIDLNLHGLHPELVRLVGRMRYRTSYGQNLLGHSIETARISSLIASELDLDPVRSRRA